MQEINDSIRAAVKVEGLPERAEIGSWNDVLKAMEKYLVVELPRAVGGIIYSAAEPSVDERGKIWIRSDGNAGVLGVYYYIKGGWKPLAQHPDGEVIWIYGDSANPPEGYKAILEDDGYVDPSTVTQLKNRYIINPGSTDYIFYAARYIGY